MHELTLLPKNETIGVSEDESLFSQLKKLGINLKSTCGGCASCGQCVIVVKEGESNLNELPFEEKQLLGNVFHITKERLACQTMVSGPVTIDISAHLDQSSSKPKVVKKRTQQEAEAIVEERKAKAAEKRKNKPKQVGGSKKPKAFKYKDGE
jgi:2Fe-2S ferredoxin